MASCETLPPGNKSKEIFGSGKNEDPASPKGGGSDLENQPSVTVDPRLPISKLHAYKLRQSWKCVRRDLEQTALDALISMLRKKANYSSLMGLSPDRIGSGEFETMAMKMFSAVDECVNKAADMDVQGLVDYAEEIKHESPFNEKGLIKDYQPAVLTAIKQTLGDRYSDTMDSIYNLVIKFIVETMSH